jgi:hypothetical protein
MLSNHRLLLIVSIIWGYFSVQAQEFMFKRHEVDIIPEFTYNNHKKFTLSPTLRYRYFFSSKFALQARYTFENSKHDFGLSGLYFLRDEQKGLFTGFGGHYGGFYGLQLTATLGFRQQINNRFFINTELDLNYTKTGIQLSENRSNILYLQPKVGIGVRF